MALRASGATAQFDAYGRRFNLTLADNERVLSNLSAQRKLQLRPYRLLRGQLDGQPGSWVRLTESAAGVEGAIWDGHDLYAVTSYGRIVDDLTTPLAVGSGQTVIYRLSDARDLLPQDFCALQGDTLAAHEQTPLQQYRQMVGELQGVAAGEVSRQIEISLIADSAFAASENNDPTAAMLARLNIVEGIFSEQVGLLVLATDVRILSPQEDPFSSTKAATLLEQLGKYRAATPAVRARGLAHLMTGRNLDGTTAGIAYVASACEAERGVSLSERSYGTTVSAIVMAHELGHNFGAPHDGESGGACAKVAGGYVMSPTISGYANFSQCSLDVMRPVIEAASCVTAADFADLALDTATSRLDAEGGVPFTLAYSVRSAGTKPVEAAAFSLVLPDDAGLRLDAASAEGASCSISELTATCDFGTLPAGEQRAISITAHALLAGTVAARARVSASNDSLGANDARSVSVAIRSGVDAAVSARTDAAEVPVGAPLQIRVDVRSLRALPVRNAVLSLSLNQAVTAAAMPGASCTTGSFSVLCNIAEIAPGATLQLTASVSATAAGPLFAAANVTAAGDGDTSNNSASAQAWVQAERDVELTAGPSTVDLAVGGVYEVPYLVRNRGAQVAENVVLWVSASSQAVALESIAAEDAACTATEAGTWRCDLGSLAPGAARLLRARVLGLQSATAAVRALAETAADGYSPNNSADVQFSIDNAIDVAVLMASGGVGIEDQDIEGQVSLTSGGRDAATSGTLDLELNAAGVLRAVRLHNGADCELLSLHKARCALPVLARGATLYVDYTAQFADPGAYDVKFTVQVPGDTASGNDTLTRPVLVRPNNDIGVAGTIDLGAMLVGDTRETTFAVAVGQRALDSARFTARHHLPGLRVDAVRASAGECRVDEEAGAVCDFTALAAGARLSVTLTWRAESALDQDVAVSVSTPGDVVSANNEVRGRAEVLAPTDLELRVGAMQGGARGATLEFPPISVVNGDQKAVGARLEVTLPGGFTLLNVSAANAICSGTALLRCDFAELDANSTSTVHLTVRASESGSYVSSLKLTSLNDLNPHNDSRDIELQISGAGGSGAASAKAGGGGRFEWLGLALLGWLVWRRPRRACRAVN
ncbi:MAG TPA: M12 family metallo-peptidase [Steroidobacteraceae bacterium]|nr:M12 family metallo-peptidase [Steroidobacteraceae bacterium]